MRHKSSAKKSSCQDVPETPEQKEIRLLKKRLEKSKKEQNWYEEHWRKERAAHSKTREELHFAGKIINLNESRPDIYKTMYETEKINTDIWRRLYEGLKKEQDEANEKNRTKWKDKLLEHDLIPGESKIKIPCDNCKLNGNCKIQDIWIKGKSPRSEYGKSCDGLFGPYPPEEGDQTKFTTFPFDLVDSTTTEEILN